MVTTVHDCRIYKQGLGAVCGGGGQNGDSVARIRGRENCDNSFYFKILSSLMASIFSFDLI